MSKKIDAPVEREMTPGEIAANDAHLAAHARAVEEERAREKIVKAKIADGTIDPSIKVDQMDATPGRTAPRAADVFPTNAEQHGGAQFVDTVEPPKSSKK